MLSFAFATHRGYLNDLALVDDTSAVDRDVERAAVRGAVDATEDGLGLVDAEVRERLLEMVVARSS